MPGRARRSRRLRAALAAVALGDLAVLGVAGFLLANRSTTTVVDLDAALDAFHDGDAATTTIEPSAPAGGAEGEGAAVHELPTAPTAAPSTAPTSTSTSSSVPTSAPATPKAGALAPPQPGVYRYRTTGGENISLLGAHHAYPAETYAAVHRTGGCGWQFRAEVVKEHVDRREMCSDPDRVLQLEQQRAVTFFGTTDGALMRCDPPQVQYADGDVVGTRTVSACSDGAGADATMTRTIVWFGSATVGGTTVETVTYRVEGAMTGRVRGTSVDLYTVVRTTGLPVHMERTVDTIADAFGTSIRYQEQATFDLVSLTPQT
jgi:hypothetical protein